MILTCVMSWVMNNNNPVMLGCCFVWKRKGPHGTQTFVWMAAPVILLSNRYKHIHSGLSISTYIFNLWDHFESPSHVLRLAPLCSFSSIQTQLSVKIWIITPVHASIMVEHSIIISLYVQLISWILIVQKLILFFALVIKLMSENYTTNKHLIMCYI